MPDVEAGKSSATIFSLFVNRTILMFLAINYKCVYFKSLPNIFEKHLSNFLLTILLTILKTQSLCL